ncbi:MAG: transposase [Phycisphaeraceae bacterium]
MTERRRKLKRYEGLGDIRYITCSCYQQLPLFQNDKIKDAFVAYLGKSRDRLAFKLYAWVVMPEHFHILLKPASGQNMPQVLRGIKAGFAKMTIERWRELDAPILRRITDSSGRLRFWQTGGGYDRNLYSEHKLIEKITYIHQNPVRRGLVERSSDWRWSSVWYYEKVGSYVGPAIDRLA